MMSFYKLENAFFRIYLFVYTIFIEGDIIS